MSPNHNTLYSTLIIQIMLKTELKSHYKLFIYYLANRTWKILKQKLRNVRKHLTW